MELLFLARRGVICPQGLQPCVEGGVQHGRLRQVHGQALDDDERRAGRPLDRRAPIVHGRHGELRDAAALRQERFAHRDGLGQVEVIPVGVALHPVAAGIEPTGEIHDSRAG